MNCVSNAELFLIVSVSAIVGALAIIVALIFQDA